MPRYIDADALRDALYDADAITMKGVRILNQFPTLSPDDVRGVGEWVRREKSYPNFPEDSDYRYECSVCGWSDQHNEKMIVPFCWHCGARMKGAEDGTTD